MSHDVSKRTLALTMVGVFFILQGVRVIGVELADPDHAILYEALPREVRMWLWIATGALTAGFAWSHTRQWVAVAAAVIMPLERVVSYLWSSLQAVLPGPPEGSLWSLADAGRWAAIVALIVVIGGWVEWDRAGGRS